MPSSAQFHTQPSSLAALIQAEQARAQALCTLALHQTPEAYRSFVILIKQRKKVGGTRQNPVYAEIELPYMAVDGRIKMATDEHQQAGKRLEIATEFVVEPASKQTLARATVASELHGTAVAHARVFLGGDGANETNPLETAETSAVGRALGFLGYGCFGTGVASAEEILRAQKLSRGEDGGGEEPPPDPGGPPRPDPAADPALEAALRTLVADASQHLRPAELDLLRAQAPTDQAFHDALRQRLAAFRPAPAAAARRGDRGQLLLHANQLGVSIAAYQAYLGKKYRVSHAGELSDAQLAEEIERFLRRDQDPAVAEGFRAQCQRLVADPEA